MVNNVLSKHEMIYFINNNNSSIKLDNLDKSDIEVVFIITSLLSEDFYMKKYTLNRLIYILSKTPWYNTKYKHLKTILFWIFLFYILNCIGFYTFIHEIFGHLYIGGSLLTEPPFRYALSYPSEYYQVDGFDKYILMNKSLKNYLLFILGFLKIDNVTKLNDHFDGYSRPLLNMNNYSDYYYSLGVNQSMSLIYISGLFPIYLLSILFITISFYIKNIIKIILLLFSGFLYGLNIIIIINYLVNKDDSSEFKDIKMFSKYYHNYKQSNSIKYYETQAISALFLVYPIIFMGTILSNKIKLKKYIPINKIIIELLNNNNIHFILNKINNISKENLKNQMKSFLKTDNQIKAYNNLHKNIINCIKVEDILKLYNCDILRKDSNQFIDMLKYGLIINIIIIPFLNAYLYNVYYIDIIKYLPMLLFIIYISEFFFKDIHNYYIIKDNDLLNTSNTSLILTLFEFLFLIVGFFWSIIYMINYNVSEIIYLWGYFYIIGMYVSTLFANLCKYNKMKIIFQNIHIN